MSAIDIIARKAACREQLKARRAAIPEKERQRRNDVILRQVLDMDEVGSSSTVFVFISYGSEVDTHALLDAFLEAGKTVAVPKIIDQTEMIATPFMSWDDLVPGQLGILTPRGNEPCEESFDLAITPGLGFTTAGHRLGYGRGYYDQWFAKHGDAARIAVAYSEQVVADIPVDDNDVPMHRIVTENGIIDTGA